MSDSDYVLVDYTSRNKGQHKVVGMATQTNYGYRGGGDRFYVHKNDVSVQPDLFSVIQAAAVDERRQAVIPIERKPAPPPRPIAVKQETGDKAPSKGKDGSAGEAWD